MTRYRVVLILFLVALTGALSTGRGLWWTFAGALFMLIVIPIAWAWLGVNWLRIARRTFVRVAQVGEVLEEEFKLTNLSRIPKLWVEVRDQSTLPGHYASRVVSLIGGRQWRGWRVKTRCEQRGRYTLGPLIVCSGDPLGIYQMQRQLDIVHTILVYPATFDFHDFPLPATFLSGGDALRRRTHYVTTNAAGVRDYVTGDSINRIHWPTSARRQRLTVKEFELDPISDVWVALDLFRGAHFGPEGSEDGAVVEQLPAPVAAEDEAQAAVWLPPHTEEYAVSIAASVAKHFLQHDRVVGLIAHGLHREVIPGERGERQLTKIMETLSVVRAHGEIPFDRVLAVESVMLARGTTLIAISSWPDTAWALAVQQIVHNGVRVVAIVIDGQSFGAAQSSDEVIAALANAGAVVRVVRCGSSIPQAIEA
ncbi:MAG: DUF58 domain-containing protein [Anaerolineae bacterium]|nr:DUF58 domain-containing protein [Candidatus Roseilinea sp.]MDW8448499.1 DUF58 domain-containing protein [Anaerolineae bacterium]